MPNTELPQNTYIIDVSAISLTLQLVSTFYDIEEWKSISLAQDDLLVISRKAYLPNTKDLLSQLAKTDEGFEIEDNSLKVKGIVTPEYDAYLKYLKTMWEGQSVQVQKVDRPYPAYTATHNAFALPLAAKAKTENYTTSDGGKVVGCLATQQTFAAIDEREEYESAIMLCEDRSLIQFIRPSKESWEVSSIEDFIAIVREMTFLDFHMLELDQPLHVYYPKLTDVKVSPNFQFMTDIQGNSKKLDAMVDLCEFKQLNQLTLDEEGAKMESASSSSFAIRSLSQPPEFRLEDDFLMLLWAADEKSLLGAAYIPKALFVGK